MSDLDQTLSAWPLPETSALERDEVAERIVDALRRELPATTRDALSDDALLAAPLPQQPGEGGVGNVSLPGKLSGLAASVENKMSKDLWSRPYVVPGAREVGEPVTAPSVDESRVGSHAGAHAGRRGRPG